MVAHSSRPSGRTPARSSRKPWLKWAALALGAASVSGYGTFHGVRAHTQHVRTESARVRGLIEREVSSARDSALAPVLEIPASVFREAKKEYPGAKGKELDEIVDKKFAKFRRNRANEADIAKRENVQLDYDGFFDELVRAKPEEVERLLKMHYRHPERESDRKFIEYYSKDVPAARKELSDYFSERAARAEVAVRTAKSEYEKKEYAAIAKKAREIGWKVGGLSAVKALIAYLVLTGSIAGSAALIRRRRQK